MPLRFVTGDIFHSSSPKAFAFGCNAAGMRGRGMCADLYDRWPNLYSTYRTYCTTVGHLGGCFPWQTGAHSLFGLVIQRTWRSRPDLTAIRVAVASMIALATDAGLDEVAIPRIGTGLQGVDWPDVRDAIVSVAATASITLTVFDQFVAGASPTLKTHP